MLYDFSVAKIREDGRTISVLSLAAPKFFDQIFIILLNTVNTLMLSKYSEDAMSAANVSGQLQTMITVVLNIIIFGMSVVMSLELGRRDRRAAGHVAGTAVTMMLILSLLAGLLTALFSNQLIGLMNLEGEVKLIAVGYFGIKAAFIFVTMIMSVFNNLLICNGYSAYAVSAGLFANVLNAVLSYFILYGNLNTGFDKVNTVAAAGVFSQALAAMLAIFVYKKKKCPFLFGLNFSALKRMLKVGVPGGLGSISWNATQVITTGLITSLGLTVLNAKIYIASIIQYTSCVGMAIASANGVLTGRYRGRGEFSKMKTLYRQNLALAVSCNAALSLCAFIFSRPLLSLFTDSKEIYSLAIGVMAVDILVEIARGANNMTEQSLNANGDVRVTFLVPLVTCWLLGVGLSYLLGVKCGMGLIGIWIGFASDEAVKATCYITRWKSGKWQYTKI